MPPRRFPRRRRRPGVGSGLARRAEHGSCCRSAAATGVRRCDRPAG